MPQARTNWIGGKADFQLPPCPKGGPGETLTDSNPGYFGIINKTKS